MTETWEASAETGPTVDGRADPGISQPIFDRDASDRNFVARNGSGELADAMGMEFTEYTIERTVARMPVHGNRQTVGYMHGGAYVVLGESLGSMAANLYAGPGKLAVGVEINATHTGSAKEGYVTGVCTPVHLGRSMTVHDIVVTDESGRRCCTMRMTNFIKDAPDN